MNYHQHGATCCFQIAMLKLPLRPSLLELLFLIVPNIHNRNSQLVDFLLVALPWLPYMHPKCVYILSEDSFDQRNPVLTTIGRHMSNDLPSG
jgi:hypothetical protein